MKDAKSWGTKESYNKSTTAYNKKNTKSKKLIQQIKL